MIDELYEMFPELLADVRRCVDELPSYSADEKAAAKVIAAHRLGTPREWLRAASEALKHPSLGDTSAFALRLSRIRAAQASHDFETLCDDLTWMLSKSRQVTPKARAVVAREIAALTDPQVIPILEAVGGVSGAELFTELLLKKCDELTALSSLLGGLHAEENVGRQTPVMTSRYSSPNRREAWANRPKDQMRTPESGRRPSDVPLDTWGTPTLCGGNILRVMFKACDGGGFLMITEEPDGEFDVWLETPEEVTFESNRLNLVWE